jgi:penicillin amidase
MPRMPARPGPRSLLGLLGRRAATTRGKLRVRGLTAHVTIARDRWGIPHVDTATERDAWFGLGFCHGQDRAFQLELLARAGRGTLSELLGRATVPIDRLSRTLGFRRVAESQLTVLDDDVRGGLEAYVAGINAAADVTPLPHELVLLRSRRRTRWEAADVLAFLGLQSLALAGNWDTELARLAILLADGPDALAAVEPRYGPWLPVTVPVGEAAGEALGRLGEDMARLRDLVGGGGASNAWAVAGSRSATGAPLLANDPHLGPSVPAPWYLAHLRTPEWSIAGASFVGGPAFPSGHNGTVAWGITAGCTDSADLFWEDPMADGRSVRGPAGPEPLETSEERIGVRGAEDVVLEVRRTPRGPIVTPILDGLPMALSLRATWLEPVPVRGFLGVQHATDLASFRAAFADWPGPALNVVCADRSGAIGWQLVGTLPRRGAGNGMLPLPAWEAENAWDATHLPYADLPFVIDPPTGFVASANHAARADTPDAPFLGADWLDGYRAARIVEALGQRSDWDVAGMAALQVDLTAMPWPELRPLVLASEPTDADARLAFELLRGWDGVVSPRSAAAAVYELGVAELAARLAREVAPRSWRWAVGAGVGEAIPRTSFGARIVSHLVAVLRAAPTPRTAEIEAAFGSAIRALRARAGDDPRGWAWGAVRPLRLLHPLASQAPLDRLFNLGPVPHGGDTNTVAQAGVLPLDPLANPAAIPNHRTVIDLGDPERSRYVIAGGQSGNPRSPHYDDLFARWIDNDGVPIAWSADAVRAATVALLELRPRP